MSRILIIDDEKKWRGIISDMLTIIGYESDAVGNIDQVKHTIKTNQYNLVLLDITLDEARPTLDFDLICSLLQEAYPGIPIVAISGKPIDPPFMFNLPGRVAGFISKNDAALISKLKDLIKNLVPVEIALVSDELHYHIEDQHWYTSEVPISAEIDKVQIERIKDDIDMVIITATELEIRAVLHLLKPYPRHKRVLIAYEGPETYYLGKFGECRTVVTKCRMGAIGDGSVILAVEQAQRVWHPKAIIMVGIAFGKDASKQKIGDVIVASQVISYEQQRIGQRIIFRGAIPPSSTYLLNRFENAHNWHFTRPDGRICNIIVGPILSGEKLVDDPAFKAMLFEAFPHAVGGEMEGAGLCAASGRVGVAWILVKAISDWGDGTKSHQHQPLAAAAATALVYHVLSKKTVLDSLQKK